MKFNDRLMYLGNKRRALNDYVDGLIDSDKYDLTKKEMWRWLYRLQERLEYNNYLDVPEDILKGVFKLDDYITRVRDYCINNHKDYDTITAGLTMYADMVDKLSVS